MTANKKDLKKKNKRMKQIFTIIFFCKKQMNIICKRAIQYYEIKKIFQKIERLKITKISNTIYKSL